MDPLSALSVASNVLAIVDFAWTLLTETRTIYNSSSGMSDEAGFTETIAREIQELGGAVITRGVEGTRKEIGQLPRPIDRLETVNTRLNLERKEDLSVLENRLGSSLDVLIQPRHPTRDGHQDLESFILREQSEQIHGSIAADLEDLRDMLSATIQLNHAASTMREDQSFLQSLHFDQISARYHNIEAAHSTTFEWIYSEETQSDTHGRSVSLKEWLERGAGTYWIYGKPGSGKSTFIKFIYNNDTTKRLLREWAGTRNTLDKSIKSDDNGSSADLKDLFLIYRAIVDGATDEKFCIFIDGLDEFQDDRHDHSDHLKSLRQLEYSRNTNIKLCVSSRPWTIFHDEFRDNLEWQLKLEDLTRDDITRYVTDKFHEHSQFRMLAQRDAAYTDLIREVVNRAQGVFLWVFFGGPHAIGGIDLPRLDFHNAAADYSNSLRI
ncbi:hypothetical protein AB5N19_03046 [Seiridium cardinale]